MLSASRQLELAVILDTEQVSLSSAGMTPAPAKQVDDLCAGRTGVNPWSYRQLGLPIRMNIASMIFISRRAPHAPIRRFTNRRTTIRQSDIRSLSARHRNLSARPLRFYHAAHREYAVVATIARRWAGLRASVRRRFSRPCRINGDDDSARLGVHSVVVTGAPWFIESESNIDGISSANTVEYCRRRGIEAAYATSSIRL